MVLIAYLLTENREWEDSEIRILRVVENEAGKEPSKLALPCNKVHFRTGTNQHVIHLEAK
jgi:hypothetical protein